MKIEYKKEKRPTTRYQGVEHAVPPDLISQRDPLKEPMGALPDNGGNRHGLKRIRFHPCRSRTTSSGTDVSSHQPLTLWARKP